ncbi:hypothetical protein Sjap_024710 [Stephania japonica]|uniref:Uncharacterized protein n=1 Tax=Stephania japonica TaxID=461633 RepID=A0AAP0EJ91_9MAGN
MMRLSSRLHSLCCTCGQRPDEPYLELANSRSTIEALDLEISIPRTADLALRCLDPPDLDMALSRARFRQDCCL